MFVNHVLKNTSQTTKIAGLLEWMKASEKPLLN